MKSDDFTRHVSTVERLQELVQEFDEQADQMAEIGKHEAAGAFDACARDVEEVIEDV